MIVLSFGLISYILCCRADGKYYWSSKIDVMCIALHSTVIHTTARVSNIIDTLYSTGQLNAPSTK